MSELQVVARVGGERFGFPVAEVQEVMDAPDMRWVPGAAGGLLGQLRYHERTVSAHDAAQLFGVHRTSEQGGGTALILQDGEYTVALVVDDVEDLATVEDESVRSVPAGADAAGLLRGVSLDAEGRLLSLARVTSVVERLR